MYPNFQTKERVACFSIGFTLAGKGALCFHVAWSGMWEKSPWPLQERLDSYREQAQQSLFIQQISLSVMLTSSAFGQCSHGVIVVLDCGSV